MHRIATHKPSGQNHALTEVPGTAPGDIIALRRGQPHSADARPIRNALDRAWLWQADRRFSATRRPLDTAALSTVEKADIRASRVFAGGPGSERKGTTA